MSTNVVVSSSPEFESKLAKFRDQSLKPVEVYALASELTKLLAKDAIKTAVPGEKVAIVVVLRSGIVMSEPFTSQLPVDTDLSIYHLGLFRDPSSLQPVEYYNKLPPKSPKINHAYILDPLLATGGTASAVIGILKDWGLKEVTFVSLLASKIGLEKAGEVWPESSRFVVGAVDPEVDSHGYVKPGLGDIGDRLFGTGKN
ncbi:uracil phosphoribosyltransferase-domain-containing protein [Dactylonectria estremocensis]|uniref:uracil phosphoribosyltransferase n=1 Tax=Dactylonectria estremocensis TaxID=1079267 RepID=A0A9P9DYX4_9HYPO|nr:uracil phosphoribosyltransferase-domain-containing protein [Dactylonectria estremocensis]